MSEHLISILMPVKDAEDFIKESVESILSQTYKNFEFIIIDDGSKDKTADIVESFKDERVRFIKRENAGLIEQLNFGLQESSGEFIARMDADDIAHSEKLDIQIDFLINNKDVHLVGANFDFMDEKGKMIMHKKMPEMHADIEFMMPFIDSVLHSTMLTYKKVLVDSGGYNKEFSGVEDDELFLRLLSKGYKMYNIQKTLYKYRIVNRPSKHYELQNAGYYKCGKKYIEEFYKEKNGEYYLRMGLLEYYRGSIEKSREMFLKCLKFKEVKKKYLFRYLPLTFLGGRIINYLRKKKVTAKLNSYIVNKFKIDTHNIESPKTQK